jgi:hypothetical protein
VPSDEVLASPSSSSLVWSDPVAHAKIKHVAVIAMAEAARVSFIA